MEFQLEIIIGVHRHWNGKTYDRYDKKYDVIKEKFDLERVSDVLWLKFTDKGHLAVVAKSCDINWDSEQFLWSFYVQEIWGIF